MLICWNWTTTPLYHELGRSMQQYQYIICRTVFFTTKSFRLLRFLNIRLRRMLVKVICIALQLKNKMHHFNLIANILFEVLLSYVNKIAGNQLYKLNDKQKKLVMIIKFIKEEYCLFLWTSIMKTIKRSKKYKHECKLILYIYIKACDGVCVCVYI